MSENRLQPEAVGQRLSLDRFRDPRARVPAIALMLSGIVAVDSVLLAERHGAKEQDAACAEQYCGQVSLNHLLLPLQAETPSARHAPPHDIDTAVVKPSPLPHFRPAKPHPLKTASLKPSPTSGLQSPVRPHIVLRPQLRRSDPLSLPDLSGLEGNDASWPQCDDEALPPTPTIRVIGINQISRPDQTNPCLGPAKGQRQVLLAWAKQGNPRYTMFYEFVINPGPKAADWPTGNLDPRHHKSPNPYGACRGGNSRSCNWQYGWNRAVTDNDERLGPAAAAVGLDLPKGQIRWLDVEGEDRYQQGSAAAQQNNRAAAEGMVAANAANGYPSGIYTLESQWGHIMGRVPQSSSLYKLPEWMPTHSQSVAYACSLAPVTGGGKRVMVQNQEKVGKDIYDHNTGC